MYDIALERKVEAVTDAVVALHVDGRDNNDDIAAFGGNVQMHAGAHHLGDVNLRGNTLVGEVGVLGTDTEDDILGLDIVLSARKLHDQK